MEKLNVLKLEAVAEEVEKTPWLGGDDVEEPDFSMAAAEVVADAMVVADGGRGWLCVPSYVVIRMAMLSAHLCTCFLTGHDGEAVQR